MTTKEILQEKHQFSHNGNLQEHFRETGVNSSSELIMFAIKADS